MDCSKIRLHLGALSATLAIAAFACYPLGEKVHSSTATALGHAGSAVVLVADGVSPPPPPPAPPKKSAISASQA